MAKETLMEKLSTELSGIIETTSKSIVLVQGRRFPSSGIVWQKNLVLATDHSFPRTNDLHIQTSSGETISAVVVGRDPATDTAILKSEKDLSPLENFSSEKLKAGDLALIIGRANRGRILSILTMISGTDDLYRNWRGGTLDQFIRLDEAPFPGFSGSALILSNGKVAGMNTAAFSRHFGLTIPTSNIERLMQRLSTKGYFAKPYLGIATQPVSLPEAQIGFLIIAVENGSPAQQAGLLIGDILVGFDGKVLHSMEEIHQFLTEEAVGKSVKMDIIRAGKQETLTVTIGERPRRNE